MPQANTKKQPLIKTTHRASGAKLDRNGGFAQSDDTCCSRFTEDITGTCTCSPNFRAIDGPNQVIDVSESFSPQGWSIMLWKLFCVGINVLTFFMGYVQDQRWEYFGYLTHWGVLLCLAHSVVSLYNTIIPLEQPPPGTTRMSQRGIFTWVLFTLAAHAELEIIVVYWAVIFSGLWTMITVLSHGVIGVVLIIDGIGVNTIPIRLRHWLEFCVPFNVMYIIWTVIHSPLVLGLGNSDYNDEDPETNDDLIYTVLDWNDEPERTAIIGVVIVFVVSPVLYLLLWSVSGCRRRYIDNAGKKSSRYVEMGSV